jgi:cell wall-associated NlpC family hydrolase
MVALLLYTLISLAPANNCHDLVAIRELRRELTFTPAPDNPVFPLWVYNWRDKMGLPVTPRRTPPKPTELVSSAREYLGVPYDWGGVSAKGFDCSGFVNKVYAENGYDIPRTSREQYKVGYFFPPSPKTAKSPTSPCIWTMKNSFTPLWAEVKLATAG